MSSVSSTESHKRKRALDSRVPCKGCGGSLMGDFLSIPSGALTAPLSKVDSGKSDGLSGRKRSPSRSKTTSRSRSRSASPKRPREDNLGDGQLASVSMVKRSSVRELRGWIKNRFESKQEGLTMLSSYKSSFEGNFELMAPELDPSMARKWLRNLGDSSDKPKLKDFWEKQLLFLQRELKDVFEPLIYLLCSLPEDDDAELPVRTATRLLRHVFPTSLKCANLTSCAT